MVGTPWPSRVTLTGADNPDTATVPSIFGSAERAIESSQSNPAATMQSKITTEIPAIFQILVRERKDVGRGKVRAFIADFDCIGCWSANDNFAR
jgi:hypothetical protein